MVRGISRGMVSAAGTFWTAIMSMFGDLRQAIIELWPYARLRTWQSICPWQLCLSFFFSSAIAYGPHNILQYFAGCF